MEIRHRSGRAGEEISHPSLGCGLIARGFEKAHPGLLLVPDGDQLPDAERGLVGVFPVPDRWLTLEGHSGNIPEWYMFAIA